MTKIIIDKEFETREELDQYIRITLGDNPALNKDVSLEMNQETLTRLSLSDKALIHGVKVKKV